MEGRKNYMCLTRGQYGKHEITFAGALANEDLFVGRGRLPSERVFLRLERLGQHIKALCSADGETWYSVGHVDFPLEDPVEVGVHAIGHIDRLIQPGAYPDGTAIRFESFRLLRPRATCRTGPLYGNYQQLFMRRHEDSRGGSPSSRCR
ncbi:DUF1349 domain-containing protein [Chloroflexi bacterium TSY]|nr:DUF1349 domain-containing protein [Chloroflexi bacterium TSY]